MRVLLRCDGPDGRATTLDAVGNAIRLGRDLNCEVAFDAVAFPKVSGFHARIEPAAGGFVLVHLSRSNRTLLNDAPVEALATIAAGDRVRLGFTGPTIAILEIDADPPAAPEVCGGFEATVQADPRHLAALRGSARADRFEVGAGGAIGRDAGAVQFHLEHPHVSRLHASLVADEGRVVLADLGSANGTFLNGRRLDRPTALDPGDRVDIGPFALRFDGVALVGRSRSNNVELAARGVGRVVRDRATGEPLTLLEDVSLVVRPREFVGILGPSGSGKSTLLAVLGGRVAPDAGAVTLNGADLHSGFEALKGDIAVVPQRDLLHDSLALGATLRYTAELRLPPDLSRGEVEASVDDILDIVGLTPKRETPIRHLSGGQVKRASLANELVAGPSLLLLDEVTSGLDEQADREVMELFRRVADGGKTVVCVTHNLANVEENCHLVAILAEGGRLAFVGTPGEAKAYFAIPRLGDVYRALAGRTPEEWAARFRASPGFRRYVADRMPPDADPEGQAMGSAAPPSLGGAGGLRQAWVLTRRYLAIWRGDRAAILAMLGQALLVGVLLGLVFGNLGVVANPAERAIRTANLLLLVAVSCFWFGCNTAAKELVKERAIFRRERDFNLRVGAYFAAKALVLTLMGVAQATVLFTIVRAWCGPPGSAAGQWLTLAALALAGTAAGLLISASARSEAVATALVPIAVIPQIILAGVIAPLGGPALGMAKGLVAVYWGQMAMERLLPAAGLHLLGRAEAGRSAPLLLVLAQAAALAAMTIVVLVRSAARSRG